MIKKLKITTHNTVCTIKYTRMNLVTIEDFEGGLCVYGNTFPIKDYLKSFKGRWNPEKKVWIIKKENMVANIVENIACEAVEKCKKQLITLLPETQLAPSTSNTTTPINRRAKQSRSYTRSRNTNGEWINARQATTKPQQTHLTPSTSNTTIPINKRAKQSRCYTYSRDTGGEWINSRGILYNK
jgi:hypothetical protein